MPHSHARKVPLLLLVIVLLSALSLYHETPMATGDEGEVQWLDDIEMGLQRSAELDRPVLLVFR